MKNFRMNMGLECERCKSRSQTVFCELIQEDLNVLSHNKTCNRYKKGQIIFYEGNRPAGIYCVHSGKVKISKKGRVAKEQIVRLAGSGDVIGYRALLGDELYSASAEALEDSEICFIDKKNFNEVLQKNPEMAARFAGLLCRELGEAENFIQSLAQKPVRQRLAEVLLNLQQKYSVCSVPDSQIPVSLRREDLANMVGTATETVIRLLGEFKSENLIAFEGRQVIILDQDQLHEISGRN